MKFILPFSELTKADATIAGGKGASLGELTQSGSPVPAGFVVLTAGFELFLEENRLEEKIVEQLAGVSLSNLASIHNASRVIRNSLLESPVPEVLVQEIIQSFGALKSPYVAVRSSATAEDGASASWAGELESYLNTRPEELIKNIRLCWMSLFTERAIFYRFEKGFQATNISVAVVVQKMLNSDVSGVAFSVHPVSKDTNQLVIEAGYGLGEAVVSGSITPDNYVVAKDDLRIVDTYIAQQEQQLVRTPGGGNEWEEIPADDQEQQKLSEEQILELAGLVMAIEKHYGFPCDIEWAMESSRLFILQSRPITTL